MSDELRAEYQFDYRRAESNRFASQIVASGNTHNPSLIVLRDKGYDLWLEAGDNGSLWCAKKDGQTFLAYSGPELLGLAALWEHLGPDWNRQRPDIYSELLDGMDE